METLNNTNQIDIERTLDESDKVYQDKLNFINVQIHNLRIQRIN